MYYRAYGLNIYSDISIPELPEVLGKNINIDVRICLKNVNLPFQAIIEGNNFKVAGNSIFRFWKDIGKFEIFNGEFIYVDPAHNFKPSILRRYLVGTIFAVFLYQRGFFVLHASSINIKDNAVAFLGEVGRGKSSTAMAFYKKGYPVVADDYIAINFDRDNVPFITPGFPRLKLSYDYIVSNNIDLKDVVQLKPDLKSYVKVQKGFSEDPIRLTRIYILERGNPLTFKKIEPQKAFINLMVNNFAFRLFKNSEKENIMKLYSDIFKNVTIKSLKVPASLKILPDVVKLIEEDIT